MGTKNMPIVVVILPEIFFSPKFIPLIDYNERFLVPW
jgi:hypothetical protein